MELNTDQYTPVPPSMAMEAYPPASMTVDHTEEKGYEPMNAIAQPLPVYRKFTWLNSLFTIGNNDFSWFLELCNDYCCIRSGGSEFHSLIVLGNNELLY